MSDSQTSLRQLTVFDLGEVLSEAPGLFEQLAAAVDRPEDRVREAYWADRDAYDRGADESHYWGAFLKALDIEPDATLIARLSHLDSTSWTTLRDSASALIADAARAGEVAILSNAPIALGAHARTTPWAPAVSHWFFSGELGIAKPDAEIYAAVTAATGVAPENVRFIDDRSVNTDGAANAGWTAHLWASDADSRSFLNL